MNKKSKIAIAATAVLATGTLGIAIPALAHDRSAQSGDSVSEGFMGGMRQAPQEHNHVNLSATITGVPAEVTDAREVHEGAYYTVALLDETATEAPAEIPADAGKRISIRPTMAEDGTLVEPTLENGTLIGDLGLRAPLDEGTTKLGLYPSDGGAPVLITIEVDADGNATATASAPLSVTYSADVAAEAPEMGPREGKGPGGHRGGHGPRGGHHHDGEGMMGGFEVEAPNA
jgi:hypothetical protein